MVAMVLLARRLASTQVICHFMYNLLLLLMVYPDFGAKRRTIAHIQQVNHTHEYYFDKCITLMLVANKVRLCA